MAVSDLTNTTWVINATPIAVGEFGYFLINFTSNNKTFTEIDIGYDFDYDPSQNSLTYTQTGGTPIWVYNGYNHTWQNDAYKTIEITSGTDVTNATLIAWLEANATQQGGGSTAKTQVGTSTISKKMFGTTPIAKEVVNGVTVYEATPTPSGYTVSGNYNWSYSGQCEYSLDNGTSWIDFNTFGDDSTFTINNVTQIMFQTSYYQHSGGQIESQQLNLSLIDDDVSQNFILTQDVTDLYVTSYDD